MPTPTWITRIWHEYRAGTLTRAHRDVLLTLHTFRGHGGIAWPSHATLAERARCCTRTVQRALQQAQGLGLVSWTERRVRAGWRWLRASNLYRFVVPGGAVRAAAGPVSRVPALTDSGAGEGRGSKKDALDEMLLAAEALPDLLALRRAAMEQRMAGGGPKFARELP
jgi:hypothetical protein